MDTQKSKHTGEVSDIEQLSNDIDDTEKETDGQIEELNKNSDEIKSLTAKLESIALKLGGIEGKALVAFESNIQRETEKKEQKIADCEQNLEKATSEMSAKQTEVQNEIGKRNEAYTDIETAEVECKADLSDAKSVVEEEKGELEEANERIQSLNEKIGEALVERISNSIADVVNQTIDVAKKGTTGMTIFMGICGGLFALGKNYESIAPTVKSFSSQIKDIFNEAKDTLKEGKAMHGFDPRFDELQASEDIKNNRKKQEYKQFLKTEERLKKQRKNDYV